LKQLKPLLKKSIGYGSVAVLVMAFGADFVTQTVRGLSIYLNGR
jgi:hypothetical protein